MALSTVVAVTMGETVRAGVSFSFITDGASSSTARFLVSSSRTSLAMRSSKRSFLACVRAWCLCRESFSTTSCPLARITVCSPGANATVCPVRIEPRRSTAAACVG